MPQRAMQISRRALLRMAIAGTVTGVSGYSLLIEPSEFQIERVKVDTDLPVGLRIGALSDFHLADTISQTRVETAARLLAQEAPDLIVLLGDYSTAMHTGSVIHGYVETALEILGKLDAPLGVYAILGNHDVTPALPDMDRLFRRQRLNPLINTGTTLAVHGERFAVVGLTDAIQANPDPGAAMRNIPGRTPVLGLVHEPDASSLLRESSLVLSGHSHGGQVRLPFIGAPVLPQLGRHFPWGLRRNGDTLVYTSRGVGMVPPRIRINCRPEITILEVVRTGGRTPMSPIG